MANVALIDKAIEHIQNPDVVLGKHFIYRRATGLCCAVGEMLKVAGVDAAELKELISGYQQCEVLYDLTTEQVERVWTANDMGGTYGCKESVVEVLEGIKVEVQEVAQ